MVRERRILQAAEELILRYPDDFTLEYSHNNSVLMGGMERYFIGPIDKSTRHKIAGAIAHRIRQYKLANQNWREEMKTFGHVSPSKKYSPYGTESPGKEKPRKLRFHGY